MARKKHDAAEADKAMEAGVESVEAPKKRGRKKGSTSKTTKEGKKPAAKKGAGKKTTKAAKAPKEAKPKAKPVRASKPRVKKADPKPSLAEVRKWAWENGMGVALRGTIPARVMRAYQDHLANPAPTAPSPDEAEELPAAA